MAALKGFRMFELLARSLLIQGSWNYRTMQGAGVGFALIPVLKRLHRDDPEALAQAIRRHVGFYNGHPYLSTVAIAALARMEREEADAGEVDRFKRALVSPLGSLGDRLVWARWRPLTLLLAAFLYLAGAAWWAAAAVFLLLYNLVHLMLRVWGLRLGWREGRAVGRVLIGSPLRRLPDRLTIPLAAIAGGLLPLLALTVSQGTGLAPFPAVGSAVGLAALGVWRPALAGRLAAFGMLLFSLGFVILGQIAW